MANLGIVYCDCKFIRPTGYYRLFFSGMFEFLREEWVCVRCGEYFYFRPVEKIKEKEFSYEW